MKRRQFITLVGSAAAASVALPVAARAQPSSMPVVGILSGTNSEARLMGAIRGPRRDRLRRGTQRCVRIPLAEGRFERLPALAAELVGKQAAVIIGDRKA